MSQQSDMNYMIYWFIYRRPKRVRHGTFMTYIRPAWNLYKTCMQLTQELIRTYILCIRTTDPFHLRDTEHVNFLARRKCLPSEGIELSTFGIQGKHVSHCTSTYAFLVSYDFIIHDTISNSVHYLHLASEVVLM